MAGAAVDEVSQGTCDANLAPGCHLVILCPLQGSTMLTGSGLQSRPGWKNISEGSCEASLSPVWWLHGLVAHKDSCLDIGLPDADCLQQHYHASL